MSVSLSDTERSLTSRQNVSEQKDIKVEVEAIKYFSRQFVLQLILNF